jgi:hypothetical protein
MIHISEALDAAFAEIEKAQEAAKAADDER